MQHRMFQWIVIAVVIVGVVGCCSLCQRGEKAEAAQQVSLAEVPEPARTTIEKKTAGGAIKKIEKTREGGKTIYDVEATVQGRDVEYDVAADGSILTSGQSVPYASVPAAVRASAEKYFGSAEGLTAFQEIEGGKTYYEVSGKKDQGPMTLKLTETGKIIEKEKE